MAASAVQLTSSLDYLTDAAQLLRETAPEISAHLMGHRAALTAHHDISHASSTPQDQFTCAACGCILVPGQQGTEIKLASRPTRPPKISQTKQRPRATGSQRRFGRLSSVGPTKQLLCGHCRRTTQVRLRAAPEPFRTSRVKGLAAVAAAAPAANDKDTGAVSAPAAVPKQAANASSKARAKNRKAGLQALLSGQKQHAKNPLSLADFLKK